jgi:hypothetical protein
MLRAWNRLINWWTRRHPTKQGRKEPSRAPQRPRLENLEDRLTPSPPFNGFVAGFSVDGLFRFTDAQGFRQLTPFDPSQIGVTANGDVVADFGTGLVRYSSGHALQHLNSFAADQFVVPGQANFSVSSDSYC